jgi:HAMP domain-containing protein
MKRKLWWIVLLGMLAVGAVVYFVAFGQFATITPRLQVVHDATDVYYLLVDANGENRVEALQAQVNDLTAKLNDVAAKLDAVAAQVTEIQSVVGVLNSWNGTSSGLAQFLWGAPGVGLPRTATNVLHGQQSLLHGLQQLILQLWDGQIRQ